MANDQIELVETSQNYFIAILGKDYIGSTFKLLDFEDEEEDIYFPFFELIKEHIPFSYSGKRYLEFTNEIATYYVSRSIPKIRKLLKDKHNITTGDDTEDLIRSGGKKEPYKIYRLSKDYKKDVPENLNPINN